MAEFLVSMVVLGALCTSCSMAALPAADESLSAMFQVVNAFEMRPGCLEMNDTHRLLPTLDGRGVAKSTLRIRENPHVNIYEAVVALIKSQYGAASYDILVYDVSYRGGQTWHVLHTVSPRRIPALAQCSVHVPSCAISPSRRHLVLHGFGVGACANRLAVYHDRALSVLQASRGEDVPFQCFPALTTVKQARDRTTGSFTLVSFGGSHGCHCDRSLSNVSLCTFSNSIWTLQVDTESRKTSSWEELRPAANGDDARIPSPRANPYLFTDGSTLLLFGGVSIVHAHDVTVLHASCDFWRYNMTSRLWVQLRSNLACANTEASGDMLTQLQYAKAAFMAERSLAVVSVLDMETSFVQLFLCNVRRAYVACRRSHVVEKELNYIDVAWLFLSAGSLSLYVIRTDGGAAYQMDITDAGGESGIPGSIMMPLRNAQSTDRFPGFQDCYTASSLSISLPDVISDGHVFQTIFFFGECAYSEQDVRLKYVGVPATMAVWTLVIATHNVPNPDPRHRAVYYTLKYVRPGPRYPRRTRHSITALNDSKVILYGGTGTDDIDPNVYYDRSPWCFDLRTHYWKEGNAIGEPNRFPPRRALHVAFRVNSSTFAIQGGLITSTRTPFVYADLWMFVLNDADACLGSWYNLTGVATGGPVPCRYSHTATEYDGAVLLFGGQPSWSYNRKGFVANKLYERSLTMIRILSTTNVVIRYIPFIKPVPPRILHSLSLYAGQTDLLLLGGRDARGPEQVVQDEALLLKLSTGTSNQTCTPVPFFKFAIASQSIVRHVVVSGLEFRYGYYQKRPTTFMLLRNERNCPLGFGRTHPESNSSCKVCPIGYYSATIASQCKPCEELLTTNGTASTQCIARDLCTAGFCHDHGACFVNKADSKPYCDCQFGYLSSDNCKVPSVYLSQLAAIVFSATVLVLCIALYKFIKKRNDLTAKEVELQQKHRDLRLSERKLDEVNRGTMVRWSDLNVLSELSSGRYSKVFLAELSDMKVVAKVFPARFAPGPEAPRFDIFVREAETLRSLRHPNIVIFMGAGCNGLTGCPFLVMEYLVRGSLGHVLHDASIAIDISDKLRFSLDAARGMRYLHNTTPPQIHRDLKSGNLLVSDKWVVKVADLETARLMAIFDTSQRPESSDVQSDSGSSSSVLDQQPHVDWAGNQDASVSECGLSETPNTAIRLSTLGLSTSRRCAGGREDLATPLLSNETEPRATCTASQADSRIGMTCGVGTDRWRAPESITKNIYTEKTDVYSFGVVLWEIYTRQTPYPYLTAEDDICREIVNGNKPIFPPDAPYAYRLVAEQCMKTKARERPLFPRIVSELYGQQQQAPGKQQAAATPP